MRWPVGVDSTGIYPQKLGSIYFRSYSCYYATNSSIQRICCNCFVIWATFLIKLLNLHQAEKNDTIWSSIMAKMRPHKYSKPAYSRNKLIILYQQKLLLNGKNYYPLPDTQIMSRSCWKKLQTFPVIKISTSPGGSFKCISGKENRIISVKQAIYCGILVNKRSKTIE